MPTRSGRAKKSNRASTKRTQLEQDATASLMPDKCESEPKFTCGICLEDQPQSCRRLVAGDAVCYPCFKDGVLPLFTKAADFESQYPPKWGETTLKWYHFKEDLGAEFIDRFLAKEKEYKTPFEERIYCHHLIVSSKRSSNKMAKTLGRALTPARAKKLQQNGMQIKQCDAFCPEKQRAWNPDREVWEALCNECSGLTCKMCKAPVHRYEHHICTVESAERESLAATLSGFQQRGRDFQLCLNEKCQAPVQLKDGCNFLECKFCDEGFCYICGRGGLEDRGDHWGVGKPCPRYNQPGAGNAVHDGFGQGEVVEDDWE